MSEARLLRTETAVLGRRHALEHLRARRDARRLRLGPPEAPRVKEVVDPTVDGEWSARRHTDVTGIHATLLPTGKVLFFDYGPGKDSSVGAIWDPVTNVATRIPVPDENIWCAGQTLLADGRVLVVGGNIEKLEGNDNFRGLDSIWIYDPASGKWTFQGRMNEGRWYPTTTLLPDGRVVITSGLKRDGSGELNTDVDVFTPAADPTKKGTIETVGQRGLNLYPFQHVVRDGRMLVSGPFRGDVGLLDPATWQWKPVPEPHGDHYYGSAVLLPDGPGGSSKVMVIGGDQQAGTEVIDAENLGAGWTSRAPLPEGRRNANSVLTPDGAIITIGGNLDGNFDNPQYGALRYDPAANAWTELAAQAEPRGYHSTALLLPDGRIVSAGDDGPLGGGGQDDEIEVFSPPYLFTKSRPQILSAPSSIGYGQRFAVGASAGVAKAVLIAPGATTHANDMHQRLVPLALAPRTDGAVGVDLTAPADSAIAPPGDYMLFLVDASGAPSTARFVHLSGAGPPPVTTPPASTGTGTTPGPSVTPSTPRPVTTTAPAPLAARSFWREGFENAVHGIPKASRVGAAHTGSKALWIGRPAVVPGPALLPGRYRLAIWVRGAAPRLTATATGATVRATVRTAEGLATWTRVTALVRLKGARAASVALRLAPGGRAIVDDLELKRIGA